MENRKKALLVSAAVAGLVSLSAVNAHADDKNQCWGVNKCKGEGACGGPGHGCAGHNGCKGQGWLEIEKDTCLKIQGARLTPPEAVAAAGKTPTMPAMPKTPAKPSGY